MRRFIITLFCTLLALVAMRAERIVYQIDINDEINSKSWIYVQRGLEEANALNADLILLHLNTYGGEVSYADSIRSALLNSEIPVVCFIDNNAASAGALISIACKKIYMRKGASIGAATVVNGADGQQAPDKYQSYMRSMIRSTAEAHGKDSLGNWVRDPLIAEAMVDNRTVVPGLIDSTKTLTLTTNEAMEWGYCDGEAESVAEVLEQEGYVEPDYKLVVFKPSAMDNILGILTSTALQSILIMLIIGGIYFELQTPGIGFPLVVALTAAALYFAPLYLEGLAENWEILIFVIGVILLLLELFVIPGFGIAGILGIICIVFGLVMSLIGNVNFDFSGVDLNHVSEAIFTVVMGMILAAAGIIYLSQKIGTKGFFRRLALEKSQEIKDGYIGVPTELQSKIGLTGVAATDLRPAGKINIDDVLYDAVAENGFIERNKHVKVVRYETGQLYVDKT